ncbi:MAG: hypothetical protein NT150_02885 [Bacteroidetes bacterium]|nr:hypothetical protein [Bacteroidota bacterium]
MGYERKIPVGENFGFKIGVGVSGYWDRYSFYVNWSAYTFNPEIKTYYSVNKRVDIELGLIYTIYENGDNIVTLMEYGLLGHIGYRYNFANSRMYLGLSYTPLIYPDLEHWGAIRIGFKFGEVEKSNEKSRMRFLPRKKYNLNIGDK